MYLFTQFSSLEVVASLPKLTNLKGTIRRVRRNNCTNFNPSCLEDLEIPEEFQITDQGDQFVCYDSGMLDNRERVIIFATNENINILKKCSQWYSDGTFKTSPPLFNQLFIVHGKINDATLLPLVYCLMTHRSQKSYSLVFNFLVDKLDGYEPQSMMSDFELAPRNAFSQAFSSTIQRGCYFHYMQSIWKHIQAESDISRQYKSDQYFAFHIRYLVALAFFPSSEVIKGFDTIMKMPFFETNKELLHPFTTYFENTWIGCKKRSRRSPPLFEID